MHEEFIDSVVLLAVLFNPFLMTAYLQDLMATLSLRVFASVLLRAFAISGVVFCAFAIAGDKLFSNVLQVRFEAFLIFGGIVFLVISIRFMTLGAKMIETLRGPPQYMAGALAMPFMIGPGTVSASVLIGQHLPAPAAVAAIGSALLASCLFLLLAKWLLDSLRKRSKDLVEHYLEIAGRVAAVLIGTIAVDMILRGFDLWLGEQH